MTTQPCDDGGSVDLHESWATLAAGLHAQRLVLHLEQRQHVLAETPPGIGLFSQVSPEALASKPEPFSDAEGQEWVKGAGLAGWVGLPVTYGLAAGEENPLSGPAAGVAQELLEGVEEEALRVAVIAVCAASAWWVGAFATIRHLGVHHLTLKPEMDDITPEILQEAAWVVAVGTATRVLGYRLRTRPSSVSVQVAYCRAVTEGILAEQRLPGLLTQLGELRLVDLVTTSIPWRGQFTKYAGGTGAGQVE